MQPNGALDFMEEEKSDIAAQVVFAQEKESGQGLVEKGGEQDLG